ncbi:MAG: TonB-dependent receptor [Betaproteobacteria bacterium]
MTRIFDLCVLPFIALLSLQANAQSEQPPQKIEAVEIQTSRNSQLGVADSANSGVVTQKQLEARTVYRPGELLEATPGLIVSQHSGEGKANQFYLRGFNLDHGTDLRTSVDGMLVNQRSHSHGQGWTDLNFLIPELASRLEYRKGPYYAAEGDFATAGAASVIYADRLPEGIASLTGGQNGLGRMLIAASPTFGKGNMLYAIELFHNNGPFVHPDNFRKLNGVLRYSEGTESNGFNVSAMAYSAKWNSTDQIPSRALGTSILSNRFDTIDPTDGGRAGRFSLSAGWQRSTEESATRINAYLVQNKLDLFSNFTYFADDPDNGDQFAQPDRRVSSALNLSHRWQQTGLGQKTEIAAGLQLQNDNIYNSLYRSKAQQRLSTTRTDHIVETSVGAFAEVGTRWTDLFRSVVAIRADRYRFKVASDNGLNSGTENGSIASPKLSLIFGPWATTEAYVNAGRGFHSNDARGTTITVDPKSGDPVDMVSPLVRSNGFELGLRSEFIRGLQSSISIYRLEFDSELVFVGDAGTTEAGRPSRRNGFEISNYYKPTDWLTIDADVSFARARFRDNEIGGKRIPGAVEGVASLALAVDNLGPWFGALQLRYFGPRPLIEDNSVRSRSTMTLNGRLGYRITRKMRVELEGFNLANRKDSAIDYYYASKLRGEAAPVDDIHFHPIESRSLRMNFSMNF